MIYPLRECIVCHFLFHPKRPRQKVCRVEGRNCLKTYNRKKHAEWTRNYRRNKKIREYSEKTEAYREIPTEPSDLVLGRRMF